MPRLVDSPEFTPAQRGYVARYARSKDRASAWVVAVLFEAVCLATGVALIAHALQPRSVPDYAVPAANLGVVAVIAMSAVYLCLGVFLLAVLVCMVVADDSDLASVHRMLSQAMLPLYAERGPLRNAWHVLARITTWLVIAGMAMDGFVVWTVVVIVLRVLAWLVGRVMRELTAAAVKRLGDDEIRLMEGAEQSAVNSVVVAR